MEIIYSVAISDLMFAVLYLRKHSNKKKSCEREILNADKKKILPHHPISHSESRLIPRQ